MENFCKKHNLTQSQFIGKEIIKGGLDLSGLQSIPEGFNPTVGGYLDLRGLQSIPEGFNPTVGGSLYLRGLKSNYVKLPENTPILWGGGKYMKVDGIFTEVVKKRGNVYHVKKLNIDKVFFLITDGDGKWSHGDTLKEAKGDLMFKISNRTKDDYKDLKLTDILSFEDGITCYRVITGACSFGTKDFVINRMKNKQKKYSISEIIKMTKGEYGNTTFSSFFSK